MNFKHIFPDFLPEETNNLVESTSIELAQKIQSYPINTSLLSDQILTTYVQQGEGNSPILLLHGFDSSLFEFRRLLPKLSNNYQTWAIDLLGFGFTQRHSNLIFNPLAIKTHLYYFWKTLITRPMILVGVSMGGATAIDFTLTYPEVVKKLVLIDSAGLANPPLTSKLMFPPLDRLATSFLSNLKVRQKISESAYYDKNFASLDAQICAALHLKCDNWSKALISFTKSGGYGNFQDQLAKINQETLILWGENDQILGTKAAKTFKQILPNNQLIWIKNCGHVPHLEQSEITAQEIIKFINQS
jgi:pimeloyl-ACP methyl ester carboxylesterase